MQDTTDDFLDRPGISSEIFGREAPPEALDVLTQGGVAVEFVAVPAETRDARRIQTILTRTRQGRIRMESVHVTGADLSCLDPAERTRNVAIVGEQAKLARQMGADRIVIHPSKSFPLTDNRAPRIASSRQGIEEVAHIGRDLDLRVDVEIMSPHKHGTNRAMLGNSVDELLRLLDGLADGRTVGVCLDTNHANLSARLPDVVRELGGRLSSLHVSDNYGPGKGEQHLWPFEGVIDWERFLHVLRAVDYRGAFTYEVAGPVRDAREVLAKLRHNLAAMRRLMKDE